MNIVIKCAFVSLLMYWLLFVVDISGERERLLRYLENHQLISDRQYGFHQGRSAGDLLVCLTHCWAQAAESNGEALALVSIQAKGFTKEFYRSAYLNLERPHILYLNNQFARVINFTSRRSSRSDEKYYLHSCFILYKPVDNSLRVNVHLYEFVNNMYKPSFTKFDFTLTQYIHFFNYDVYYTPNGTNDAMQKVSIRSYLKKSGEDCLFPPGKYYFSNITVPAQIIPNTYYFGEGRIFSNLTNGTNLLCSLYIDIKRKVWRHDNTKRKNNTSL